MKTPYGKECRFYYADYFRGKSTQECRLILANSASDRWKPALCQACPVPQILFANACPNLALQARIGKALWGWTQKIEVQAACLRYADEVTKPQVGCGHCHEHIDH